MPTPDIGQEAQLFRGPNHPEFSLVTEIYSHGAFSRQKKVNVSSVVFTLQDFNMLPGNGKARRYFYTQEMLFFFF